MLDKIRTGFATGKYIPQDNLLLELEDYSTASLGRMEIAGLKAILMGTLAETAFLSDVEAAFEKKKAEYMLRQHSTWYKQKEKEMFNDLLIAGQVVYSKSKADTMDQYFKEIEQLKQYYDQKILPERKP